MNNKPIGGGRGQQRGGDKADWWLELFLPLIRYTGARWITA